MLQHSENHPITKLKQTSQMLSEQTSFAQRQTANNIARVHNACESIVALDMERSIRQLRQMIALFAR